MSDLPKRRRSLISTPLAVLLVGVTLIFLLVMRVYRFLFRRHFVALGSVRFPVLVVQPDGGVPFAEWDAVQLEKFAERSPRTPMEGTILIDSDFQVLRQENVKRKREGDLKWMARYLLPDLRVKYRFDLRRLKGGREAAMALLSQCPAFDEKAGGGKAVTNHATLAGVLEALDLHRPAEPTPLVGPGVVESDEPVP